MKRLTIMGLRNSEILKKVYWRVYSFSFLGSILGFRGFDTELRYNRVIKQLGNPNGKCLEVGSGGVSPLTFLGLDVLSLDIRIIPGVDVAGSITHLPFKDKSFSNVVCVDTIEHIPRDLRPLALSELIRVARERAILHTPLEDGRKFLGRRYDIAFDEWFKEHYGVSEPNTSEHILNVEPSPLEFQTLGFSINGTYNARLWFGWARYQYRFFNSSGPFTLVQIVKMGVSTLTAWIFYLSHKQEDEKPPFWGGICIFDKRKIAFTS